MAVNNPPGFYLATGLHAIVIPDGPPETLHQIVERYNADWIVLEENHPQEINDLYTQPIDLAWLESVETIFDSDGAATRLLRVQNSEVRP